MEMSIALLDSFFLLKKLFMLQLFPLKTIETFTIQPNPSKETLSGELCAEKKSFTSLVA